MLIAVVFGLVGTFLVFLRRGEFARRLLAMKASPAACVTLGLNLTRTKVQVFALSAAIAGLGGALYGAQLNSARPDSFRFLQGLPIVLLAVIGGIGVGRRRPVRRADLRLRLLHHPRHRPVAEEPPGPGPGPGRRQPRAQPERCRQRDRPQHQGEDGAAEGPGRGRRAEVEPDWEQLGLDDPLTDADRDLLDQRAGAGRGAALWRCSKLGASRSASAGTWPPTTSTWTSTRAASPA